ncbi:carboxy-S-adenosyl-L-methionine synthase CmoA [Candidatus Auribacterota bacterium]
MKKRDTIYRKKREEVTPFVFDKNIADVFDDMLSRSIPYYDEQQKMIVSFSLKMYQENSFIYDIGCSTGNTIAQLFKQTDVPLNIKAVDKSIEMLDQAKKKCNYDTIEWICKGVEEISFDQASVIISSYVLQFVERNKRKEVLQKMYEGLKNRGVLLLSEKVKAENKAVEETFTKLYYDFKRKQNYTNLEIEQKEMALKNILTPFLLPEYLLMLKEIGFKSVNIIFKYLNFMTLVASK